MRASTRTAAPPILTAKALRIGASGTAPAVELDLNIRSGELHLVLSPEIERSAAIVDALLGLGGSGDVSFGGVAWAVLPRSEACRRRGSIGRVLSEGNWMETRSVMENLLLPLRHHTVLPDESLRQMASDLARRFGLPGLPILRPDQCSAEDLERAACVKAFVGRPELAILEHPMEFADSGLLHPLIDAIQRVRRRGGAVLWFTRSRAVLAEGAIGADRRYRVAGARLLDLEGMA